MNLSTVHSLKTKIRFIISLLIVGLFLNACKKGGFDIPLNVGTIRFMANSYTIENNTQEPLTITLPFSLPLEQDATVKISVDQLSNISSSEYTISPEIPADGLILKLSKGAVGTSFQVLSQNNFEGDKTLVLTLTDASGALTVANTNASAKITIKGNPVIVPEISVSESGLAFGNVITSTISESKTYVLMGTKLTEDVEISATQNFEVSLDDQTFSRTLTVPFSTINAAPVTIYTRFLANTGVNQMVMGSISHHSGTVPDVIVNLTGVEYGVAAPGVLLTKEDFVYGASAGDLTTRSAGSWSAFSGNGLQPVKYLAAGLTYNSYPGAGGALSFENGSGSREDVSWDIPEQNSGVIYTSQLINFASAPNTNDFFLSLGDGDAGKTPAYFNRIYAKSSGGQLALGIARKSSTAVYGTKLLDYGKTYLIVHKFEFVTGSSSMYVIAGAIPAIEPPVADATSVATGDPDSITRIVIRQSNNAPLKATVDGFRVATSWKEAVGL